LNIIKFKKCNIFLITEETRNGLKGLVSESASTSMKELGFIKFRYQEKKNTFNRNKQQDK
jgi:hypothetical protein